MRYALLLHYPEMSAKELGEEALAEGMAAFDAYAKALDAAGALRSAEVLTPSSTTTTITRATGEWQVAGAQERTSLADEARYLAVLLASLLDDAEACGLASLISFAASRARAREVDGRFVPLEEQDPAAWDDGLVADGERLLARATLLRERSGEPIGRFQLEAALQAAHAARRRTGRVDWDGVLRLTEALVTLAPTAGARVALAAASARVHGPEAGLALLDGDPDPRLPRFQPAWATRARLLADAGRVAHARDAYDRAISLTTEPAVRVFLEERRRALG